MTVLNYILNNKPGNKTVQVLINATGTGSNTVTLSQLAVSSSGETVSDYIISRVWWTGTWTLNKGGTDVLYLDGGSGGSGNGSTWDLVMSGMSINSNTGGPGPVGGSLTVSSTVAGNQSIIVELVKISTFVPGT